MGVLSSYCLPTLAPDEMFQRSSRGTCICLKTALSSGTVANTGRCNAVSIAQA